MSNPDLTTELREVHDNQNATILQLNYKGLKQFPQDLLYGCGFSHIEHVYLKRNLLTALPEDISRLSQWSNLVELYLHSNEITELPAGLGALQTVQILNVGCNNLSCLPPEIGKMTSLQTLQLSNNDLTRLPKEIGQLKHLTTLEVMNNKLTSLPAELGKNEELKFLRVDKNQLQWLPKKICLLRKLEELSAAGNNLLFLPPELCSIQTLRCVYVDNNVNLHLVPYHIVFSTILGMNGCGRLPVPTEYDAEYSGYNIVGDEYKRSGKKYQFVLPPGVKTLELGEVLSLKEIAARYLCRNGIPDITPEVLPPELEDLLNPPLDVCHGCEVPVCTSAVLAVTEMDILVRYGATQKAYLSAFYCSQWCYKERDKEYKLDHGEFLDDAFGCFSVLFKS